MYEDEFRLKLYSDISRMEHGLFLEEFEIRKRYLKNPGKLLAVGCGGGREVFELEKEGFEVTGVDLSPGMIEAAERNKKTLNSNAEFKVMNAVDLDFEDNSYDYILMWNQIFENIPKEEERIRTLKNCSRILKPNGVLSYTVFNQKYSFRNLLGVMTKSGSGFFKALRFYKNFVFWRNTLRFVKIYNFLFRQDMFKKKLIYINKSGYCSVRQKKGSVLAHIHSYKDIIAELNSAGFDKFKITSFEELRYEKKFNWKTQGSVLLYVTVFKK